MLHRYPESIEQDIAAGHQALMAGNLPRAADLAQNILRSNRSIPEAWVILCLSLMKMGSGDDERAFRDALANISPQHDAANMLSAELSRVLAQRGLTSEAMEIARACAASSTLTPRQRVVLSNTFSLCGLFEESLEQAEIAVQSLPTDTNALYNLALALRYMGKLDEAEAGFERVLALNPTHALAHFSLADTRRWTGSTNHVARLEHAIQAYRGPEIERARIHYALFKESHDVGQYSEAWASLAQGAEIVARTSPFDTDERRRFTQSLLDIFRGDLADPPSIAPVQHGFTPVFIVGLPRSGTTLVERILGGHPRMGTMGETYALPVALRQAVGVARNADIDANTVPRLAHVDWKGVAQSYARQTEYLREGKTWATEKLPYNYHFVGAIRRAFPEARIVHLRRHPLDSLFGAYKTLFGTGSYLWSYTLEDLAENYRLYRKLTDHWRSELGEAFVEVILEDLIADPEAEIRRLLDRLGLDFHENCLSPHETKGGVSTASSVQVRRPINRDGVDAWLKYSEGLEPLRKELERDGFLTPDGRPVWDRAGFAHG